MKFAAWPPEERLFIALDVDSLSEVQRIVETLGPRFRSYKIGLQLFSQEGPRVIQWLAEQGCRVFADLKFHDIPNTVARASAALTRLGVTVFNVHAAGGVSMMERTWEAVQETAAKEGRTELPIVLGVTQLTSISETALRREIGIQMEMEQAVLHYAALAKSAGLGGVVASAQEARQIRRQLGEEFVILTPGIRPAGAGLYDQSRVATPAQAFANGADLLVVGRPITAAADMQQAADAIVEEIAASQND